MHGKTLAPIAVFAFRRPWETIQVLHSLARCPEAKASELYVFCDGARSPSDAPGVRLTREFAAAQQWCGKVTVVEQERNLGLARSVVSGVTNLVNEFGRVIVLEDDLLVSSGFLEYMNRALERYADDNRVGQISAHSYLRSSRSSSVFLPVGTTWGWGTWKNAWSLFEHTPDISLLRHKDVRERFDLGGAYPYSLLLEAQLRGEVDSWGVRWWWGLFRSNKLVLHPTRSLVKNIGFGSGATHTVNSWGRLREEWDPDARVDEYPADVCVNETLFSEWKATVRGGRARRFFRLAHFGLRRLKRIVPKV